MPLLPVAEALARVLAGAEPTGVERVTLLQAAGRVLAADVAATLTQPPFDTSAMDGYAVQSGDVARVPVRLRLAGESAAGHAYRGELHPGETVRISTGAPLPAGADAVVIQENTERDGDRILINEPAVSRQHIRRRGFDFSERQTLLRAGELLNERSITLAAAAGHAELAVRRKPRVAILATGDELVEPGTPPGPDQIVSSNSFGLAALVTRAGADPLPLGIARDSHEAIADKIARSAGADILVTIGGASVGDHDLIGPVLKSAGADLDFWKIAMRPGKPLLFGRLGDRRVLGLPGNPVSCLVTARVFLLPLIRALLGRAVVDPIRRARLTAPLEANGPRTHYMRAALSPASDGALPFADPLASQDSSALSLLTSADCLIIRPAGAPALAPGALVDIMDLDF